MKVSIFAFTKHGCLVAEKVACFFRSSDSDVKLYTTAKHLKEGFSEYKAPISAFVEPLFAEDDFMIFVGSCGIAVRAIAPFVKSKKTDPGVIVIDEAGNYAISLLSGHIGGANRLTEDLAKTVGAVPVITTATDINGKFSVDQWASENNLHIGSMKYAKDVASVILEEDIPLLCEFGISGEIPKGTKKEDSGKLGIYIGIHNEKPFESTLNLYPRIIRLGIGCRRNTPEESIRELVYKVFSENNLSLKAVKGIYSIDLKADEKGLLSFAESLGLNAKFYTSEELLAAEGDFTPSSFVKQVTGVDNVCERSAMLGSDKLIVRKTALNGVTVAVAVEKWEAKF